ncbi:TetR/AcrR family transcriptional regulator [Actinomadura sp. 6N118]|uniref:TetR/AcrR family transcriptional regulator n=1 Tax=Actinomadura sp. 6N118 TaxID=3375151 RepID=UPI00378FE8D4
MPRHVDHDARRKQIATAVCELIAERGFEAATLREVADRAGVSMGAVQRAFPKDGMLRFALEHVIAQTDERGKRRIEAAGKTARALLTITLQEMALADEHRVEARVWLTFLTRAGVQKGFAQVLRDYHDKARALLVWLVQHGQTTGEIHAGLDADLEAQALQALTDGLTQQAALGYTTPDFTRQLIDHATTHLWTSKP